MGNKELAGKLLLAVATAGLTTCGVGAVDPAPEPLVCSDVGEGQTLDITGTLDGSKLSMGMTTGAYGATWKVTPGVIADAGLTIDSVSGGGTDGTEVLIEATLDAGATTASFTVTGTLTDGEVECSVTRQFTVTVTGTTVEIAEFYDLPISPRRHATIEMLRREGLAVDLQASGAGAAPVTWTPTGGAVSSESGGRARWTLPSEPGVYQVEMLVDHGESGFTLDTLTLEVLG